jgi:ribosome-associated translation inhibitor RaiA
MQVQINTGHNIAGDEAAAARMRTTVEESLSRVSDSVTRVEVHLSDQDGSAKAGVQEMRCMLEARLEGREPVVVTHAAATVDQAIDGAAGKLARLIQGILGRTHDRSTQP